MSRYVMLFIWLLCMSEIAQATEKVVWKLGEADNSYDDFALAPDQYRDFLKHDFGWEDKHFIIGTSEISDSWPYALPGPSDAWGGTSGTAGWRSSVLNIQFDLKTLPSDDSWKLVVDFYDISAENPPLFKISINDKAYKYQLPSGNGSLDAQGKQGKEHLIEIPLSAQDIKKGSNKVSITTLQGSWIMFDQVRLEGPEESALNVGHAAYIQSIKPAAYEVEIDGMSYQPLLIELEHIKDTPLLKVMLDGKEVFRETIEEGNYVFEAPMPAVVSKKESIYEIRIDDQLVSSGTVQRAPYEKITYADYVNTMMGAAHSRWMIAPGPWMPFSMVKLSPDNQDKGWQAGYDPIFESIGGFSHIHEWTLSGLLTMPVNGPLEIQVGSQFEPRSGYRSRIDKSTEQAGLGYYRVHLTDYDIWAELTSTTRCGFQRYTFPEGKDGRILLDLYFPSEYDFLLDEVQITKIDENRVEGYSKQRTPNTWSGGITQEYTIHFVVEFDQKIIRSGTWTDEGIRQNSLEVKAQNPKDAGMYVEFDTRQSNVVQMRTGISYVSIENAIENLETEISDPFGWDFDQVVEYNKQSWNELLGRVKIKSNDRKEKVRFYSNMYRSFCRNTYSDVNGSWVDPDEKVQILENPNHVALGCDAFWNTFWNLNQLWNLVTPEWSSRWVNSQLAMYDTHGWLAKGPAGMEFIPVMVAEHEIPLIVGAYQMGIGDFDAEKAFQAMKKMQTTPGEAVAGGYAGNRDLETYLKHGFVPSDEGRFSNSLEYAFDDWTVSQMAKSLGKVHDFDVFSERGSWWKNVIDKKTGYARLRSSDGKWDKKFDPFKSGANHHYVEGNAWQLTFFVPQDVPGLANFIGKDRFLERLEWGFGESYKWRFNAPNDQYWDYPVMQGNQQSMHFSYLFNWVQKPWLTQKWTRSILERYYGYGLANAYLGDEDQGQMSAWFVMAAIGLFQTDGGCRVDPVYEIGSPLYEQIEIDLGNQYGRGSKFTITANNASRSNKYIQSAKLNGVELLDFKFPAKELLKGGSLELEMGPNPNMEWGILK